MKIDYQRSLGKNCMVVKELAAPYTKLEAKMFEYNKMPGIMQGQFAVADGELEAWYNITGMQSLEFYLKKGSLRYEFLTQLIEGICIAVKTTREFLLRERGLCITQETIFFENGKRKLWVCYVPAREEELQRSLGQLWELILQQLDHEDKRAVDFAYQVYQRLSEPNSSILDITYREGAFYIEPEKRKPELKKAEADNFPVEDELVKSENISREKHNWSGDAIKFLRRKKDEILDFKPVRRQDDIVCNPPRMEEEIYPTVLLNSSDKIEGKLTYLGQRNEDDFQIGKPRFVVGKSKEYADGIMTSNAVSRIHAMIEREGDNFCIEDLNSANGTYINGERLHYKERRTLKKEDVVMFACEKYKFS